MVSTNKVYLADIDSEYTVSAFITDGDGVAYIEQPEFQWSSAEEHIATVDSDGKITAVAYGETAVTVSADGKSLTISVVVSDQVSTLFGLVRYEDKEYDARGFTSKTGNYKAIRFAQVMLVNQNDQVLQTTHTDDQGRFSISDVLTSQHSIVVVTQTDKTKGLNLNVKDRRNDLYAVRKKISLTALNEFVLNVGLDSDAAGAFNILDVFTNAAQFTFDVSSATTANLSAFWQPGNNDGTYYCERRDSLYCTQGRGVYVYHQQNADTDEFDDDVLYHEYAHYFADDFSKDDSPGGCHLLSSKDLDLRLAWSEGWGDFFPAAVKQWLAQDTQRAGLLSTTLDVPIASYVDSYGRGAQIYFDLSSVSANRYRSAANELAVAKILWEASQQFGVQSVMQVLSSYMVNVSTPVNLEAFWDGWQQVHQPGNVELVNLQAIFNERKIYYQADAFEQDNVWRSDLRVTNMGEAESHFLYHAQSVDTDIVAFNVKKGQQYTVETFALTSGADTNITVLDQIGKPLVVAGKIISNDDHGETSYYRYDSACGVSRIHNDGSALASKVSFVAPSTGTYYAEVSTSPDSEPYLSAGRYGTYELKITTN